MRYWVYNKEKMERLLEEGRIVQSRPGLVPQYKRYLDEVAGVAIGDTWNDISAVNSMALERLGYPTQKPLPLLERIIEASSNPGDVVLDPFCGCGTAVHAAQKLGRDWIGIDVTHLAISLIRRRMEDAFPGLAVNVIGEPVDLGGARDLALQDKYQFQWWALDRIGAQPVAGKKKGSDKGIDGVIPFVADRNGGFKRVMVSVKGGETVGVQAVRDLRGVIEREGEPIGVLLTLAKPTKDMETEAISAGHYQNELWQKQYPKLQILTVQQVLSGKRPEMPPHRSPFAEAPVEQERSQQGRMV
jgi:hypothetical protein